MSDMTYLLTPYRVPSRGMLSMARNSSRYRQVAASAAEKYGLDPTLFVRQIQAESGFNPRAGSPAGAQGIAQIMPSTARGWGVDPWNPEASLDAAARAMAKYVNSYGGWRNALVAYNAGPGRVGKPLYSETRAYIDRILGGKAARGAGPRAPMRSPAPPAAAATGSAQTDPIIAEIFSSADPVDQMIAADLATTRRPMPTGGGAGGGVGVGRFRYLPRRPGEPGYKYLQRLGATGGLRNDPGIGQLYGGRHAAGSDHYAKNAVDFGTARNDPGLLDEWVDFLKQNKKQIGVKQTIWKAPGHYDHAHSAVY